MLRHFLLTVVLVLALGSTESFAQSMAGPVGEDSDGMAAAVSGELTAIDLSTHTISVGINLFHVPADLGLINELQVGMDVIIHFQDVGGKHVVSQIVIADPA